MTDYFTKVKGAGYMSRGKLTRDAAIKEARNFAEYQRNKYAAICEHLSQPDDKLEVKVVKGAHVEHFVCDLPP